MPLRHTPKLHLSHPLAEDSVPAGGVTRWVTRMWTNQSGQQGFPTHWSGEQQPERQFTPNPASLELQIQFFFNSVAGWSKWRRGCWNNWKKQLHMCIYRSAHIFLAPVYNSPLLALFCNHCCWSSLGWGMTSIHTLPFPINAHISLNKTVIILWLNPQI